MRRQREEDSYGNTLLFAEKYTKNYLVTEVVLLKSGLVSHVDITWNSFLPYLIQLTNKLEALGFRYVDNKVIILQEKADEK